MSQNDSSFADHWDRKAATRKIESNRKPVASEVIARTQNQIDGLQNDTNMWGKDHSDEIAHLEARITELHQASAQEQMTAQEQEDAEWTPETTAARRAIWNARVQAPGFRVRDKMRLEIELGFTLDALKRQVTRHELRK